MREIKLQIQADRSTVDVELPIGAQRFTADQLDAFIQGLIAVRARMQPAIPQSDPQPGAPVLHADGMRWCVGPSPADRKRLRLGVMHPGLGWLGMEVDARRLLAQIESVLRRDRGTA
ncbi:MAG TPA: hypothetical protein VD970_01630 [Acetobacteraceae bacterium]|nr:hypothetical protein [Acetobacteraceae bacterium]